MKIFCWTQTQKKSAAAAQWIGMLTDSGSFLSYTRHEYFGQILCGLLNRWVEDDEFPDDRPALERLAADISYRNSIRYFGFE